MTTATATVCLEFARLTQAERAALTPCIGKLLLDTDCGWWEFRTHGGTLHRLGLLGPTLEDAAAALTPGWGARLEALTDATARRDAFGEQWRASAAHFGIDSATYTALEAKLVSPLPGFCSRGKAAE